jgi:hypothetical protein
LSESLIIILMGIDVPILCGPGLGFTVHVFLFRWIGQKAGL